uniref:Mitochondrial potassium channel n=1 Tax=Geotrypetes seraphini TaxID=260995 RepID=A0A6P8PD43_GEOSA|nr:mitochondrial potassium channel [Geotrypetes seraphini]XP_033781768.1 mitochondrial potassium channel [Geotrypetes seraphini]XP_033781769.1 mitochondrial potassium channel [Geotrypetes seraphini]XP_033781770.1 mitochondrial potassium channel [Geotrypetes seraphini]
MQLNGTTSIASNGIRLHQCLLLGSNKKHLLIVRAYTAPAPKGPGSESLIDPTGSTLHRWADVGKALGRSTLQRISTSAAYWWDRYEEFVGLVEVREAQGKVTEAEKAFMIARGIVREARDNLESQQAKLKEIRDRLDRVSRDDIQYLELATQEHRLLQEEKRLRTSYINAEDSERERFSLFSAAVRESHEKERTRAERTKNWSIFGSVLGAVIGVLGSTYINRVRLQELKSLVLEAQKGPASLQEAIHEQASVHQLQQKDLGDLIVDLRDIVHLGTAASQGPKAGAVLSTQRRGSPVISDPVLVAMKEQLTTSKQTRTFLETLQQQFSSLEKGLGKVAGEVQTLKSTVQSKPAERAGVISLLAEKGQGLAVNEMILELSDVEQRLGTRINRNSLYSTALTCTMFALTIPLLYIFLKSN